MTYYTKFGYYHPRYGKSAPTDEEIIFHLKNKVEAGLEIPPFIVEEDIYSKEPWMLNWSAVPYFLEDEGYFLTKRKLAPNYGRRKKDHFKRDVDGENVNIGGWWNGNRGSDILNEQNQVIGHKKSFTFTAYKNSNKNRAEASRIRWYMREYTLPSNEFQEWAICHIKNEDPKANYEFLQLHHPQVIQQQWPKRVEEGATYGNSNELNTTGEELINNEELSQVVAPNESAQSEIEFAEFLDEYIGDEDQTKFF